MFTTYTIKSKSHFGLAAKTYISYDDIEQIVVIIQVKISTKLLEGSHVVRKFKYKNKRYYLLSHSLYIKLSTFLQMYGCMKELCDKSFETYLKSIYTPTNNEVDSTQFIEYLKSINK